MPLYEYQCDACGRRVERIQKFSDPPLDTCPHCGGKLTKLLSSPAFHLKGTGWYATDYKDTKGAKESKDTKDSKDSKGDAGDKKDAKGDTSGSASSSSSSTDGGTASASDKASDKPSKT
jgi:putative FmdB family regulatory protein